MATFKSLDQIKNPQVRASAERQLAKQAEITTISGSNTPLTAFPVGLGGLASDSVESSATDASLKPQNLSQPQLQAVALTPSPYQGMNETEARYARELQALRSIGELYDWHFEPITFKLAHRTTYTPDFFLIWPDGRMEFIEIKGKQIWDDAKVKFKTARDMFPYYAWRMLQWDKEKGFVEVLKK